MINQKGFSLIEVLIAVAILASIGIMLSKIVSAGLEGRNRVERSDEVLHGVRVSLQKMTEDLAQAFVAHQDFVGAEGDYQSGMKGEEDELHFSTMGHYHYIADKAETDHVTVSYTLERDGPGYSKLMRRESLRLGSNLNEGGSVYPILDKIKSLKFSFYDGKKEDWVNDWNSKGLSAQGSLPKVVKIELTVVELDEGDEGSLLQTYEFQTLVKLASYAQELQF